MELVLADGIVAVAGWAEAHAFLLLVVTIALAAATARLLLLYLRQRRARLAESSMPREGALDSAQRRLDREVEFQLESIREIHGLLTEFKSVGQLRRIPGLLMAAMVRVFKAERTVVLVRRTGTVTEPERSDRLIVAAAASAGRELPVGAEIPIGDGQLGMVARSRRPMSRDEALQDGRVARSGGPVFDAAAPVVAGDRLLGVIAFDGPHRHHPQERELLQVIAQIAAMCWHNLSTYRRVRATADVDELTAIYNKRFLKYRLSEMVYDARQQGGRVAVFMFDIDHFKSYNDSNGHLAGDRLLRHLASLVRDTVRADDVFGRFGGEEFLLVMPGRQTAEALLAAQTIRRRIEEHDFEQAEGQPGGRLTISGGVATFPDDAQDSVELLLVADEALYRAKAAGRNRVLPGRSGLAPDPDPSPPPGDEERASTT